MRLLIGFALLCVLVVTAISVCAKKARAQDSVQPDSNSWFCTTDSFDVAVCFQLRSIVIASPDLDYLSFTSGENLEAISSNDWARLQQTGYLNGLPAAPTVPRMRRSMHEITRRGQPGYGTPAAPSGPSGK
jgi:hypothetical protein